LNLDTTLVLTENQMSLTLLSGEQNCFRKVRALVVGGGGAAQEVGGGGGSGHLQYKIINVWPQRDILTVEVGIGGVEDNNNATASLIRRGDNSTIIEALGGSSAVDFNGADGYSGGGAYEVKGGFDGSNGQDNGNYYGGKGDHTDLASMFFYGVELNAGLRGDGHKYDFDGAGGGGGGGITIIGANSPDSSPFQGEGFGGGGGFNSTFGLPGCVILEMSENLRPLRNLTTALPATTTTTTATAKTTISTTTTSAKTTTASPTTSSTPATTTATTNTTTLKTRVWP